MKREASVFTVVTSFCRSRCVVMCQRGSAYWRTAGREVNWAFLWGDAWTPSLRVTCLTRAAVCFPEPLAGCVFTRLSLCLIPELQAGHWDAADKIHLSLMVDHVTEVSQWMVGVKRLIAETRKLSPELWEPLRKSEAVASAESVQDSADPVQESGSRSWLSFAEISRLHWLKCKIQNLFLIIFRHLQWRLKVRALIRKWDHWWGRMDADLNSWVLRHGLLVFLISVVNLCLNSFREINYESWNDLDE